MIRNNLRTRPRGSFHTFRRHRGFTLVEVMMSVVLVAIGTALALPSYRDMVEKRQLTNRAEQLAAFANSAQTISSRTNQIVTVSYTRTADNDWCMGAVVSATACNCNQTSPTASDYCEIDSQPFVMNESLSDGSDLIRWVAGDGSYAFDPIRGLLVDPADALAMELVSNNGKFVLTLAVNNTGRVILCSHDTTTYIPGYDIC